MSALCILLFTLLATYSNVFSREIINNDVQRTLDASSSTLKVSTKIKIINFVKSYELAFPTHIVRNLAFVAVTSKSVEIPIHSISK